MACGSVVVVVWLSGCLSVVVVKPISDGFVELCIFDSDLKVAGFNS